MEEEEEHSEDEFDSQEDLYVEFNTQDYEFIQRICLQTDQFKEYLFEIMYKDWQESDIDQNKNFDEKQKALIKEFLRKTPQYKICAESNDEENEDDGGGSEWESENSFKEDLGVGDLSEQDLKYIEEWKKQSDQLQNYIIEKKSNLSKYNFSEEEKQFIKDFKNQSREIKHFVGYDYIEF
ncbi:hypothetical protein PPERSA_01408 [Pseudocohnilembus persalinus]|uniref:Uncharacterized protein n=1 Tax=Pseudocohnilembus persalinus TaxID=266149 RepID=A0A0V0QGT2_PSEPJ|nr:hypothetical protein PPERSA_01408 [Pseudocohnilembus persalinus]|eukprot:KRX01505.1 hypothetical protein PPERSA_01408 [Pseudocohnilembus persalinus]